MEYLCSLLVDNVTAILASAILAMIDVLYNTTMYPVHYDIYIGAGDTGLALICR